MRYSPSIPRCCSLLIVSLIPATSFNDVARKEEISWRNEISESTLKSHRIYIQHQGRVVCRMVKSQGDDRTALVLYGSATGNAEDLATELGRITERLHFLTRVSDLDSIDIVSWLTAPSPRV